MMRALRTSLLLVSLGCVTFTLAGAGVQPPSDSPTKTTATDDQASSKARIAEIEAELLELDRKRQALLAELENLGVETPESAALKDRVVLAIPTGTGNGPVPELKDEEREAIEEILAETWPAQLEELRTLRRTDPDRARQRYAVLRHQLDDAIKMRKNDPVTFNFKLKDLRLGNRAMGIAEVIALMEYEGADQRAIDRRMSDLEGVVAELFQHRTLTRDHEMSTLMNRVAEIQGRQDSQSGNRLTVIAQGVQEFLQRGKESLERQQGRALEKSPSGG